MTADNFYFRFKKRCRFLGEGSFYHVDGIGGTKLTDYMVKQGKKGTPG